MCAKRREKRRLIFCVKAQHKHLAVQLLLLYRIQGSTSSNGAVTPLHWHLPQSMLLRIGEVAGGIQNFPLKMTLFRLRSNLVGGY